MNVVRTLANVFLLPFKPPFHTGTPYQVSQDHPSEDGVGAAPGSKWSEKGRRNLSESSGPSGQPLKRSNTWCSGAGPTLSLASRVSTLRHDLDKSGDAGGMTWNQQLERLLALQEEGAFSLSAELSTGDKIYLREWRKRVLSQYPMKKEEKIKRAKERKMKAETASKRASQTFRKGSPSHGSRASRKAAPYLVYLRSIKNGEDYDSQAENDNDEDEEMKEDGGSRPGRPPLDFSTPSSTRSRPAAPWPFRRTRPLPAPTSKPSATDSFTRRMGKQPQKVYHPDPLLLAREEEARQRIIKHVEDQRRAREMAEAAEQELRDRLEYERIRARMNLEESARRDREERQEKERRQERERREREARANLESWEREHLRRINEQQRLGSPMHSGSFGTQLKDDLSDPMDIDEGVSEANPPPTVQQRFKENTEKWTRLQTGGHRLGITFQDVPWPSLSGAAGLEDLTEEKLLEFFTHVDRPELKGGDLKGQVKADLLLWHPDKFRQKYLKFIAEVDRDRVSQGVGLVAKVLIDLGAVGQR